MALKEQDIVFTTQDGNGNTVMQMPITRVENVEGILDFVYPVGSLYWSKKATNPSTLFGGTWTRVKDKFILAAGDSYAQGATGGEAAHKLTVNEMPSHNHTASSNDAGGHTHTVTTHFRHGSSANRSNTSAAWDFGDVITTGTTASVTSSNEGSHSHAITVNSAGGGVAHNNMPPYVAYYCWERTA